MDRTNFHRYQNRAVNFALRRPYCALWMDMGLGKSVVALTVIKRLFEVIESRKTLIVAPKRVAYNTWPNEIKKWDHLKDLDFQVIKSLSNKDREVTRWNADVHIINREIIPWWVDTWLEDGEWPYDTVILDESSGFKDPKGKWFKKLKSVRYKMDRVIQLTGTPISTSLLGVWAQAYLLDQGRRLGPTFNYFRQRYFRPIDREERLWVPKQAAKTKIYKLLSDLCLTMKDTDYLELPGQYPPNILTVDISSKLRDKYRELEREFLFYMDETKIKVNFAAECRMKLMQFCNGAIYTDKSKAADRPWKEIHNEKLDALEEVLDGAVGNQVLIGYKFKSDAVRMKKRFKDKIEIFNSDDSTIEKRWNEGKVGNLAAHPQQMGFGVDGFQFGGFHICWFGLPDSLELYQQFNKRIINRQGQSRKAFQHIILLNDSVDTVIARNLKSHGFSQLELMNWMKEDIKERR